MMANDEPDTRVLTSLALMTGLLGMATGMSSTRASADEIVAARYSASKDQVVVTIAYRGTNPDHVFSLNWGSCEVRDDGANTVAADILDNQWEDVEQNDFQKILRFDLSDMPCRPAMLTLRTAPRFHYTLKIPGAAAP